MSPSSTNENKLHHFTAGAIGGVFSVASGHPFDTIKVRLQTMYRAPALGQRTFTGLADCGMQTIRHEGVAGLFKGLVPPMLAAVPSNASFFMGLAVGRSLFGKAQEDMSKTESFLSGCVGGCFLVLVHTPAERIKCILQTRQQNSSRSQLHNVWDCARTIVRQEGFSGFYRGACITALRDVPTGGAYILTYYSLRNAMGGSDSSNEKDTGGSISGNSSKLSQAGTIMLAGGLAGMVDWTLSIAPDTLKSRVQTAPPGMYPRGARDALRDLMATEGPRGLFHGLSAVLLRSFISNAFCMLGYEFTLRLLSHANG
eukprot:scpid61454/ scgid18582/ Mitochondrial carnitine/acylcarnitine carrier protein; Carnitine/acylcarnitine translocase; Solute carrier family 25 member 20